jgi:hypothetical protein
MRHTLVIKRTLAAAIASGFVAATPLPAAALPALATPAVPDGSAIMHLAAADCYSIGQQIAAQNGGTLAKASPDSSGGQTVCRIVVLLPGKDGQRPRRAEFVVPAN